MSRKQQPTLLQFYKRKKTDGDHDDRQEQDLPHTEPKSPSRPNIVNLEDQVEDEVRSAASGSRAEDDMDVGHGRQSPPNIVNLEEDVDGDAGGSRAENETDIGHQVSLQPSVYTKEEWVMKQKEYVWLTSNDVGNLICKDCKRVSSLKVHKSRGVYIRSQWCGVGVSTSGDNVVKQKMSLRRKIFDHKNSAAHSNAVTVLKQANKEELPELFLAQQKVHFDATAKLLRTAYSVAKDGRPYVAYPERCVLQMANGYDIGTCQHSRFAATAMIDLLSVEMKKRLCCSIIENDQKFSVMLDESTTVSRKSTMVVYIRTVWMFDDVEGCFAFPLGLVELDSLKSDHLIVILLELLDKNGFNNTQLQKNLVGACSDGASVMLGKHSGVLTRLKAMFPQIFLWHCMCHRIELAVGDAVKSVNQINHVKSFLDKLYSVFSQSPKANRELEDCASQVHSELKKIGKVLDVRWVASSFRSLIAVWKSFPALCKFVTDSDSASQPKHKATYTGLKFVLQSPQFVHNLAVLIDALESISELSKALQGEACTIGIAYRRVQRTIRTLELQKTGEIGDYFQLYTASESDGVFMGVELSNGRTQFLNKEMFLQALIDNLTSRLYDNVGFKDHEEFSALLQEADILEPSKWPTGTQSPWPEGERLLRSLCSRFSLDYLPIREDFREYVDCPEMAPPPGVRKVKNLIDTLPISSADCERGFSTMNNICTDLRNSLTVPHINNLMFISLCGPSVKSFNPQNYVKLWLQSHRSATFFKEKQTPKVIKERFKPLERLF